MVKIIGSAPLPFGRPEYEIVRCVSPPLLAIRNADNPLISNVLGAFHGRLKLRGRSVESVDMRADRILEAFEAAMGKKLRLLPYDFKESRRDGEERFRCYYFVYDPSVLKQTELDRFKLD